MNEFDELVQDYMNICGYTRKEAINAATNTLEYEFAY